VGVAVDSSRNVYVADPYNSRIEKFGDTNLASNSVSVTTATITAPQISQGTLQTLSAPRRSIIIPYEALIIVVGPLVVLHFVRKRRLKSSVQSGDKTKLY
jgi:hypothetical protein